MIIIVIILKTLVGFGNFYKWSKLEQEIYNILPVVDWLYENDRIDEFINYQKYLAHFLSVRGYVTEDPKYEKQLMTLAPLYSDNEDLMWLLMHRVLNLIHQNRL